MPPTNDVAAAVKDILAPFFEHNEDDEYGMGRHAFWDFYSIGGRWAGEKLMARYPKERIDEFMEWLKAEGVTVSGITCGKQTPQPASQIPKVDAKWQEMFPSDPPAPCPLFDHCAPRFGETTDGTFPGDVLTLAECPERLECSHVVFASPGYDGQLEVKFMLTEDAWNGCNHMPVAWDGTLKDALRQYRENLEGSSEPYRAACDPKDDWLVVTVDYHL